ncbi:hypothetical protein [Nostoc sp. 2RC]|uniref:hypothetical protein n=1 Tax=Nostoc sp. 2RC TaxID=2485484 RepID=UPI001626A913|nr:hypothetical protein [Nostoc sp. 2RC]MBC1239456.1 hypothetical protein [Nostoc sp. 2RC]
MSTTTTEHTVSGSQVEKAFTLRFLKPAPSSDDQEVWIWDPEKPMILNIKTATFSGKNQADDYTNE